MKRILTVAFLVACGWLWPLGAAEAKDPQRRPSIQIALLLDTSNSMDGLIDQAKSQLSELMELMENTFTFPASI